MKRIWKGEFDLETLNLLNRGSMGEYLGIKFIRIGEDELEATMPVNQLTKQPFGLLHGGASVALAETVGSVASWCASNRDLFIGVGVEINASHLKPIFEGEVRAVCKAIKVSGKLHIWDVQLFDQNLDLCCVCRFTCMIVPKLNSN